MNDLFEMPTRTITEVHIATRCLPLARVLSERVTVTSPRTGRSVAYARLSDEDHRVLRVIIEQLWEHQAAIRSVLREPSTLYGSRGGGAHQTLGDVLEGFHRKMQQRHPVLRDRKGEDLTIKQLAELNRLIDLLNTQYGGDLAALAVP